MRRYTKELSILLAFIIVFTIFLNYKITSSYATENTNLIEVDTYGSNSTGSPMFDEGLWAPGMEQSGIMRLNNNYSERVKIHNLALTMSLEKPDGTIVSSSDGLYKNYAECMTLTITRGKMLVFTDKIFDGSFYGMLYEDGHSEFKGYSIPTSKQFNVNENENVDLEYTVTMDGDKTGNDIQGLIATVSFMVNIQENSIPDPKEPNPKEPDPKEPNSKQSDTEELIDEQIPEANITDISGHWAENCILRLIEEGIVVGYPDGTIRPENTITRAETAVLISKALKLTEIDKLFSGYMDPVPSWARGAIIATTEEGIFEGYPILGARVFKATKLITREEMATVLMRGFKKNLVEDIVLDYTDKDDISDWALEFVKIGTQENIIEGYPDYTFKPQSNITRAEAFTMVCKLLGYGKE